MNDPKPNTPAQRTTDGSEKSAQAAYYAKQAQDLKESLNNIKAPHNTQRQASPEKGNKEPQVEGHLGHTHDHLAPQMPFHLDKHETQEKDNDYYNGMSQ